VEKEARMTARTWSACLLCWSLFAAAPLVAQTAAPRPTPAPDDDLTRSPRTPDTPPPEMLGDLPPFRLLLAGAATARSALVLPSTRGFKICDNESPQPLDRVYVSFNYFDNLFKQFNLGPIAAKDIKVYRETLGVEKTFLDGFGSIGFRLPMNTLDAGLNFSSVSGHATDVGDLSVILKFVLARSDDDSSLLSAGLAVTLPTGPDSFANDRAYKFHSTVLQPFLGYRWAQGDFYVQGFSSLDVPTDGNDVTVLFNDVGVGYFLYRTEADRFLSAVVPVLEGHFNTPLNHRGGIDPRDPARTSDALDLTGGVNVQFLGKSWLALGVATPIAGPRPFDFELLLQFRCWF
jgi:hypothetical protein